MVICKNKLNLKKNRFKCIQLSKKNSNFFYIIKKKYFNFFNSFKKYVKENCPIILILAQKIKIYKRSKVKAQRKINIINI